MSEARSWLEMLTLALQFNRMRQAAITNELVDIITGASGAFPASFLLSSAEQRADPRRNNSSLSGGLMRIEGNGGRMAPIRGS